MYQQYLTLPTQISSTAPTQAGSSITSTAPTKYGLGIVYGFSAMVCFLVMLLTAWEPIRRRLFEWFYLPHQIIFPVAMLLAILHDVNMIYWLIVPVGLYFIDRAIRFCRSHLLTPTLVSAKVVDKNPSITCLELTRPNFRFKGGDYCFINIPSISYFQWHPFSVSIGPNQEGKIRFHIMDMGKGTFTSRLAESAAQQGIQKVKVDGPHGRLSIPIYSHYSTIILCAGGIGVTPLMSILMELNSLLESGHLKDIFEIHFIWAAKSEEPFKIWFPHFLNDISTLKKENKVKLHLYATRSSGKPAPKPGPKPASNSDIELLRGPSLRDSTHDVDLTEEAKEDPPQEAPEEMEILQGRPDYGKIFASIAKDERNKKMAVLACGPEPLVFSVQGEALKRKWHFHKETFLL